MKILNNRNLSLFLLAGCMLSFSMIGYARPPGSTYSVPRLFKVSFMGDNAMVAVDMEVYSQDKVTKLADFPIYSHTSSKTALYIENGKTDFTILKSVQEVKDEVTNKAAGTEMLMAVVADKTRGDDGGAWAPNLYSFKLYANFAILGLENTLKDVTPSTPSTCLPLADIMSDLILPAAKEGLDMTLRSDKGATVYFRITQLCPLTSENITDELNLHPEKLAFIVDMSTKAATVPTQAPTQKLTLKYYYDEFWSTPSIEVVQAAFDEIQ